MFNYLGQVDQLLAQSSCFSFATESSGPWHSPKQVRRHSLELNSAVINGRFELRCTYSRNLHQGSAVQTFADGFVTALRELIDHCLTAGIGGHTPSDFPLARLDQATLDRLLAGRTDVGDVYRLSPIQTLFYSSNLGSDSPAFDQWHCTLQGRLDARAFQRAWHGVVRQHGILRSSIHGVDLSEPVQMVHNDVVLPWVSEDWRHIPPPDLEERWQSFLREDHASPLPLTKAPVMRFTLLRVADAQWRFLWSVPALLLDGWSWPLVFKDVSLLYQTEIGQRTGALDRARPYRDYVQWIARRSAADSTEFWLKELAGLREPTPIPSDPVQDTSSSGHYARCSLQLPSETTQALQSTARALRATVSTLVHGAWGVVLSHQSGRDEVVFGSAFAGRPTDLPGAATIVGPLVNNVPVRMVVDRQDTVGGCVRTLHSRMLDLSAHQYTPLIEIQRVSEVPWTDRLFDSMVIFQNYEVDEAASRLGREVEMRHFVGPIHTSYALMLVAEPGATLRLTLIYDTRKVAASTAERWVHDVTALLEILGPSLDRPIADVQGLLSQPLRAGIRRRSRLQVGSQDYVPPEGELEALIASVWQRLFGLERASVEDNLFDLGGHSLLVVQLHGQLREALAREFPLVALFERPTVRSLARYLSESAVAPTAVHDERRHRAEQQRQALARFGRSSRRKVNDRRGS